jgi:ACS family hexuronate transporter-like MFS transporter
LRKTGHVRWVICGLLFFATTVNYIDRQVLGILKPVLAKDLHWTEADYGWIVSAFQFAYALMMPLAGRIIDRLGTRLGYALAVIAWSAAAMSHSLARTWGQFVAARLSLGVGEAANFPAAIKTVAEWFPEKERAFATGIFNSGSNVGAIVAPLIVPVIALQLGWRATFIVTGLFDLVWLAAWLVYYRTPAQHPGLSPQELAYIEAGRSITEPLAPQPWRSLFTERPAWAYIAGKFMTDPVWWFFLFWIPAFLQSTYQLPLTQLGLPLAAIYIAADAGSILGGWISAGLISRGWPLNAARKTAMLLCACAATPIMSLLFVRRLWPTVALVGVAAAAHQGWSANLYTLVSDTFPRRTVGSVIGLGGFVGGISGMLIAPMIGYWLDFSKGAYRPLFVAGGAAYLIALGIIQLLVPRIEQPAQ